jgi:hypothetical protein
MISMELYTLYEKAARPKEERAKKKRGRRLPSSLKSV